MMTHLNSGRWRWCRKGKSYVKARKIRKIEPISKAQKFREATFQHRVTVDQLTEHIYQSCVWRGLFGRRNVARYLRKTIGMVPIDHRNKYEK